MNTRAMMNLVGGYLLGLGLVAIWYGIAHVLGRPYTGVPTGALWASALAGSVTVVRAGLDESKRVQTSLSLAAAVSILGLIVIGVTALAGVRWDHGAPSPWFDVLFASALLAALTFFRGATAPTER